ncbi:hypothetical protein NEDG_01172 [Nematocida displodere]|uniref:Major facilitator superfamily (MFS) profile domain-containing protein n=1 Tax=Nematocida displodere TaxID=1805483 RepID=A0A177EAR2_9MICR|nr:hypothetical protein NEDG_01172 [Nematocida displodere]
MNETKASNVSLTKNNRRNIGPVSVKDMLATGGLLLLPFLFGMNIITIGIFASRKVVNGVIAQPSSIGAGHSGEIVKLAETAAWKYIVCGLFFGALLFSLALFIAGAFKKSAYPWFKPLFVASALLMAGGNTLSVLTGSKLVLIGARVVIGLGVGILCSLCNAYYAAILGKDRGNLVGVFHGLMITIGVFSSGQLVGMLGEEHNTWIFGIITVISLVSAGLSFFFVKAIPEPKPVSVESIDSNELPEMEMRATGSLSTDRPLRTAQPAQSNTEHQEVALIILACLGIHVIQQVSGINPILSESDLIFGGPAEAATKWSKVFFNCAGGLGSVLLMIIMRINPALFKYTVLTSSFGAGLAYVPLVLGMKQLGEWCAGLYVALFSMGLASLPWMLPSMILTNQMYISFASGLGPLANWLMSCVLLFEYRHMHEVIGSKVFIAGMLACFLGGVLGLLLLIKAEKVQKDKALLTSSNEEEKLFI